MIFAIETNGDYRRVKANDWKEAIRIAWKKNPPRNLGILTRISGTWNKNRRGTWGYIDSAAAIKIAGYKIEKRTRTQILSSKRIPQRRRGRLSSSRLR